ncbi:glycosyltransferase family 2 protein [Lysobacter sp. H21R4]|uniref:glycosyltransferase n=1 Tax=Lysobacter sp. H21R4 TaxID=2781021 RepID=UPI001886D201|nr:glycosyltransferase family 2 protein [Lysobacter sp. H21R4]QOY63924.1 glycosyltransferase family 2 protein [Lysobacter sp. H21R4]
MDADIGVVVVSYQSLATIDDCLARLRDAAGVAAIRVVDNDSTDGTVAVIQRHAVADPRVQFIANPDNAGFGVACNQGAAAIAAQAPSCRWLAFVNPDALVEVDTLSRLRHLARQRRAAGADVLLGVDLVDEAGVRDAAARRRAPDFLAMLAGVAARLRGRTAGDAQALAIEPDDDLELQAVEAISGALMFLARARFERVGGFDEAYRLHAEDLDLCRRLAADGVELAVANRVRVVHVRGVSSRSNPCFVEWHKHRGLWRYFRKFEAAQRGVGVRALVFALIWARFPFAVVRAMLRSRT